MAGRKRKAGDRHRCGKLKRQPNAPGFDKGSDWVQERRARFGVHYCTALGRAYAAGLLGDNADDRYMGGKQFIRVYQAIIGGEAYRSPLDDTPRGSSDHADYVNPRDHDWLFAAMDALDVAGVRPYLDQLIARSHTDHGPPWLDALLAGGKHPADLMLLKAACKALDILAPERRPMQIVAVRAE
jgi:hypothetical protein